MEEKILHIENLNVFKKSKYIVKDINLEFFRNCVYLIAGNTHSGKSTILKCLNRIIESEPGYKVYGTVFYKYKNIREISQTELLSNISFIGNDNVLFPNFSIFDNVIAGYILQGRKINNEAAEEIVENTLKQVYLWDELKTSLNENIGILSQFQRKKLCFARALALQPEIILLDEPLRNLSSFQVTEIEDFIRENSEKYTFIITDNNPVQSGKISDYIAFIHNGELLETGQTSKILTNPENKLTELFLLGKI